MSKPRRKAPTKAEKEKQEIARKAKIAKDKATHEAALGKKASPKFNENGRYSQCEEKLAKKGKRLKRKIWTLDFEDQMLEFVRQANDKSDYGGRCKDFALRANWGNVESYTPGLQEQEINGDAVRNKVWDFATRLKSYDGPGPYRVYRDGPLNWFDEYVIDTAASNESEEARKNAKKHGVPDAAYLSRLLQVNIKLVIPRLRLALFSAGRTGLGSSVNKEYGV